MSSGNNDQQGRNAERTDEVKRKIDQAALRDGTAPASHYEREGVTTSRVTFTQIENQLLGSLPVDWWQNVHAAPGNLERMVEVEIPEMAFDKDTPRTALIAALLGLTKGPEVMYEAIQKAGLDDRLGVSVFAAVRDRKSFLANHEARAKAAQKPQTATDKIRAGFTLGQLTALAMLPSWLQREIHKRGLQTVAEDALGPYSFLAEKHGLSEEDTTTILLLCLVELPDFDGTNEFSKKAFVQALNGGPAPENAEDADSELLGRTRSATGPEGDWLRESLDYIDPRPDGKGEVGNNAGAEADAQRVAALFDIPTRFVTPAQQTWDTEPAEPATQWKAIVPTREQSIGIRGARVTTNIPVPTPPSGPVVETDPRYDAPEPREELAEELKSEQIPDTDKNGLIEPMYAALAVTTPYFQNSIHQDGVLGIAERLLGIYRTQQMLAEGQGTVDLLLELARKDRTGRLLGDSNFQAFAELLESDGK